MRPSDAAITKPIISSFVDQGVASAYADDPANNTVIVDTGVLNVGWYDFYVSVCGEGVHYYGILQHRNANNNGNIWSWYLCWNGNNMNILPVLNHYITQGERMRIVNIGAAAVRLMGNIDWKHRLNQV